MLGNNAIILLICAHLCSSVAWAVQLPALPAIPAAALVAPVITNKPVPVYFGRWPTNQWVTNEVKQTQWISMTTAYGVTTDSNYTVTVTTRTPFPMPTNCLVTAFVGTDMNAAQLYKPRTNSATSIITNQGPVTFWLPPTNRYVISLWGLMPDGGFCLSAQTIYPSAPSNQVRFISTPVFSANLRDWTAGTNSYSFTVTNGVDYGTNIFVRWSTAAVKDDFTQKAVVFDANTFNLFPANSP